jgi:hypothetical protein
VETPTLRYTFTFTFPKNRWFQSYAAVGDHDLGSPPVNSTVAVVNLDSGMSVGTFDVADGVWTFDSVAATADAPVAGSFDARLWARP